MLTRVVGTLLLAWVGLISFLTSSQNFLRMSANMSTSRESLIFGAIWLTIAFWCGVGITKVWGIGTGRIGRVLVRAARKALFGTFAVTLFLMSGTVVYAASFRGGGADGMRMVSEALELANPYEGAGVPIGYISITVMLLLTATFSYLAGYSAIAPVRSKPEQES